MRKNIFVTGASGFIGNRLCRLLNEKGYSVRAAVRNSMPSHVQVGLEQVVIDDISSNTEWADVLKDVDCVVHLAARVHIMNENAGDPLAEFRTLNVDATLQLAKQAAKAGVKRFIYLSSIKVNGEKTSAKQIFSADDVPNPEDPYAISKYEAEQALQSITEEMAMDVVIIRPPLVYGPGVKANFRTMMKWLAKGVPLPFGAIYNSRSLVALDNLVDFIVTCIEHPSAAGQVFLVSDGDDMSTTRLLQRLSRALGVKSRLIPLPVFLLKIAAFLIGKRDIERRLCDSLRLDIKKNKELLGWSPPYSVDEMFEKTAKDFYKENV